MGKALFLLLGVCAVAGCDGGGSGDQGGGSFRLIQFLENNQANIARNHAITFLFSGPVRPDQDFAQRLKTQSVQQEPGSDFTLAIGDYLVTGDRVGFTPRLPNLADRSDAGYRADGNYVVFLKGGPDALESAAGDRIATPQEFAFVTSQYFEDIVPQQPPRALGFVARDPTTLDTTDLSRLDPRPAEVAIMGSADLIAADRFIAPAGRRCAGLHHAVAVRAARERAHRPGHRDDGTNYDCFLPPPKEGLPYLKYRFGLQVIKNEDKRILDYSELMTKIEKGEGSTIIDFVDDYLKGSVANTYDETNARFREEYPKNSARFFYSDNPLPLNPSQKKILTSLGNPKNRIIVIDGPPGTGKSQPLGQLPTGPTRTTSLFSLPLIRKRLLTWWSGC